MTVDNFSLAQFQGIPLNVDWSPGRGTSPDELPTGAGIYAEICWRESGVRVGETGKSIRGKIRHDIWWFKKMHDGTAPPAQLRRTIPTAIAAKESGPDAFEFYVVSSDSRLADKSLRQECERYLFEWLEQHDRYVSWNRQKSWR